MNHRTHSEFSLHLVSNVVTRVKATNTCLLGNKYFTIEGNNYLTKWQQIVYSYLVSPHTQVATNSLLMGNKYLFLRVNAGVSPLCFNHFLASYSIDSFNPYMGSIINKASLSTTIANKSISVANYVLCVSCYSLCVMCSLFCWVTDSILYITNNSNALRLMFNA